MDPILVDNLPQAEPSYGVKLYEHARFVMPWHMHNLFELTLIVAGRGTRIIGDNIGSFFPGDLLLVGPRLPHVWKDDRQDGTEQTVRAVTLQFASSFPSPDLLSMPQMRPLQDLLDRAGRGLLLQGGLRNQVREKLRRLLHIEGARQVLLILEILTDMAESQEYTLLASDGYTLSKSIDAQRWNRINGFILENFGRTIRAEELAQVAKLHPSSLGRYFKQTAGMRVTEYVNQVRIGHACRLLAVEEKPIVEICYDCGFQNLSHFNRCFRKWKEATPSQYRAKLKGLAPAGTPHRSRSARATSE